MCLSLCVSASSFSLSRASCLFRRLFAFRLQAIVNSTKACSRNHNLCLFSTHTRRCVNTCYLSQSSSFRERIEFDMSWICLPASACLSRCIV
uniref:Putative secreted protein n=1 Tax=Rhipicephalus microplus TaxID=6941 RepID=A0A6M2DBE5_RHIMP